MSHLLKTSSPSSPLSPLRTVFAPGHAAFQAGHLRAERPGICWCRPQGLPSSWISRKRARR